MKRLILCGMPGSGKTTLAKRLGEYWNIPWYDLDILIEVEGTTIEDLFKDSELMFRHVESYALFRIAQMTWDQEFVLALGGGTLENVVNLDLMQTIGTLCFLDVPVPVLAQRLSDPNERAFRPLLRDIEPEELEHKLHETRRIRLENYLQSPIITGLQAFEDLDLFTKRVELFTKKT
ncbi:MAG: hypothetical protein H6606_05525 [Flavobacteriales bacterium]|nr:hypothetical protein [Flavobacteriales bacterium]